MTKGKRVEIVKLTVDGVEVDAKECTKCGEVKALECFGVDKRRGSGRTGCCLECWRIRGAAIRKRVNPTGKRRRNTNWTTETFHAYVNDSTRGEYTCVSKYRGSLTHIRMRHNTCECEWLVRPANFISSGTRCPECTKLRKTHDEFVRDVFELVGVEYTVKGQYKSGKVNILMVHNACGHEWLVRPNNFLTSGTRCPACASSRGETRVATYLSSYGYQFTREQTFDDCRNKRHLPFDFAISVRDLLVVIEFDGKQHFCPVDFAGLGANWAERQLRETQRNDRIKTEYCRANGIPLIRIDYTQFDEIEAILDRELSALGVTGKRNNTDNNDIKRKEDAA